MKEKVNISRIRRWVFNPILRWHGPLIKFAIEVIKHIKRTYKLRIYAFDLITLKVL